MLSWRSGVSAHGRQRHDRPLNSMNAVRVVPHPVHRGSSPTYYHISTLSSNNFHEWLAGVFSGTKVCSYESVVVRVPRGGAELIPPRLPLENSARTRQVMKASGGVRMEFPQVSGCL